MNISLLFCTVRILEKLEEIIIIGVISDTNPLRRHLMPSHRRPQNFIGDSQICVKYSTLYIGDPQTAIEWGLRGLK